MNLFFFLPKPGDCCHELLQEAARFVAKKDLEVFVDREAFTARMRRPKDPRSVALLWNPTEDDLREIGSVKDFLAGVRVLLILHDQNKETIALAHRLLPAYIAYVDDGIPDILSVLRRLDESGGKKRGQRA